MKLLVAIAYDRNPNLPVRELSLLTGCPKSTVQRIIAERGTAGGTGFGTRKKPMGADLRPVVGQGLGHSVGQDPESPSPTPPTPNYNYITTTTETTNARARGALVFPKPGFIPDQDWDDLLAHRKKRKAADTPRALKALVAEIQKAMAKGWSASEVVDEITNRNWTGFKADWMQPKPASKWEKLNG